MSIERPLTRRLFAAFLAVAFTTSAGAAREPVWISDEPGLIVSAQQGWGELGIDAAAHQADKAGEELRIGGTRFAKGLGHHAPGALTILLGGEYERFEAEVGIQPCAGGTVVFCVVVDGETRFQSPVVKSGDPGIPVNVDVRNAQELRLEARDAEDGIACDMANWAEARLMPAASATGNKTARETVDVAPFGQVVSWDPQRRNGATASRIEEFRAEDLFTETRLFAAEDGTYTVPLAAAIGEPTCIGLQWPEQRALKELRIGFPGTGHVPGTNDARLEGWVGESAWQGSWQPLTGEILAQDRSLLFRPGSRTPARTRKVRWILPSELAGLNVRLSAYSWSSWSTTNIHARVESMRGGSPIVVNVSNGEFIQPEKSSSSRSLDWDVSRALSVPVRYSRPSSYNSDPTILHFKRDEQRVSVAVSDLLSNDCVYLPDFGLFVAREPIPVGLEEYKIRIASRRTVLEEVRDLPEQTLEKAMSKTHHEFQREGPVMLSLACDNQKFIVERDGVVRFHPEPFAWLGMHEQVPWQPWYEQSCEIRPAFGSGAALQSRRLEGGWLPIPTMTFTNLGVSYIQTTYVAPRTGQKGSEETGGVCVVEFTATNTTPQQSRALVKLTFTDHAHPGLAPEFQRTEEGLAICVGGRGIGFVTAQARGRDVFDLSNGGLTWSCELAPHASETFKVYLPGGAITEDEAATIFRPQRLREATAEYWRSLLAQGTQVETPDHFLNDLIRSSIVRCFIAARSEADGHRIGPSIAAMSYGPLESEAHSIIRAMFHFGQQEFARRSFDFFRHRYTTNGFLTTGYTTFGTGWHLWTAGEYFQLTRDTNWLRAALPDLVRSCEWVLRQVEKTHRFDSRGHPVPEFGLMPPGVLADWNSFAYHFAMNAYYAAGLREVGRALQRVGAPEGGRFVAAGEELSRNTLRAYKWTQEQSPALPLRDGTWVPHYPSQVHSPGKLAEFFPGQDAGRSWCYDVELGAHQLIPTGIIDPLGKEATRMLDHMEDVQFLADGWFDYPAKSNHADWFNLGGFSKVQPYYTRNCEIYALRDDVKPFIRSYFNSMASLVNPEVLTFWEHFHHSGAWDKTHETGYFLHQTRTLLVQERGDELWLAPFAPTAWWAQGGKIAVTNAPTRFGPVSFAIVSSGENGEADVWVDRSGLQWLQGRMILRVPGAGEASQARSVVINGKKAPVNREGLVVF